MRFSSGSRRLGVGLACDDFGTGYSALASLRRLPFDMLKIDKSFLEADPEDEKAMIILETIILLAHDLRLDVVAEGIEGEEQRSRLADLECDFGQGFFFGEPMSAKQVVEALGGSGYLGSKPGLAGFWDRVTSRKSGADKPKSIIAPPPALDPPVVDVPPPEALPPPDLSGRRLETPRSGRRAGYLEKQRLAAIRRRTGCRGYRACAT